MKSILDPTFVWTPSHRTNIKERFDRIKRERRAEQRKQDSRKSETVIDIGKERKLHERTR